jgi:hypothetical protein
VRVYAVTAIVLVAVSASVLVTDRPGGRNCMSDEEAQKHLSRAHLLDTPGRPPQQANEIYDFVQKNTCGMDNLNFREAADRSRELEANIHASYDVAMAALNHYREANGAYPQDVSEIRSEIPDVYRAAFNGFRYVRTSDAAADFVTGLYGTLSFDLGNR